MKSKTSGVLTIGYTDYRDLQSIFTIGPEVFRFRTLQSAKPRTSWPKKRTSPDQRNFDRAVYYRSAGVKPQRGGFGA